MAVNPWTKIGDSKVLVKKYSRMLNTQMFINPRSGASEEFSFFSCSVNSVLVLPITAEREIISIRQFRHAADDVFIELPGGNRHPDESITDAVRRELLEETGYEPSAIMEINNGKIWVDPGAYLNFFMPYLAFGCRKLSEIKLDSTEYIETVLIPVDEWLDMIYNGQVSDSKTLALTLLALPYIGNKIKK